VVFNFGPAGLSEMLGWPLEGFMKAFDEVLTQGFVKADFAAPLIFIPDAIHSNHPQSPNVVIGWGKTLSEIPDCELKTVVWRTLKLVVDGLGKAFQKAFAESCGKPLLNQEQETVCRKQEQEQEKGTGAALRASATSEEEYEVPDGNPVEKTVLHRDHTVEYDEEDEEEIPY
jgi:hypothetical protein